MPQLWALYPASLCLSRNEARPAQDRRDQAGNQVHSLGLLNPQLPLSHPHALSSLLWSLESRHSAWSSQAALAGSSAHQAPELWCRLRPPTGASCGPGEASRLSCCFSSVLCTHARSTLPRPWVQELFIARQQTRDCASIASWPGWAKQSGVLRCWEVGLPQGKGS